MTPHRRDFARALLRTLGAQGSWNYRSYTAGGLTYALLPLLRRIHAGDPVSFREALERHLRPFNAHPYLIPLAVGALARVEHEREDPERIARFRTALSSSLGAVGDRLMWQAWRPLCLLAAVLAFSLGLGPWVAVLVFLIPYNAGHVTLRAWGLRRGWSAGLRVGAVVSGEPLRRLARWLTAADVVLFGAVAATLGARLVGGALPPWSGAAAGAAAALAGAAWPGILGPAAAGLVAVAALAAWMPW